MAGELNQPTKESIWTKLGFTPAEQEWGNQAFVQPVKNLFGNLAGGVQNAVRNYPVVYTNSGARNIVAEEEAKIAREQQKYLNLSLQRAIQGGYTPSDAQLAQLVAEEQAGLVPLARDTRNTLANAKIKTKQQQDEQNARDQGYSEDTIAYSNIVPEASVPNVEDFVPNFADEQRRAYEALKPFYEKMLDFAKGDLDLAKRMIEYTYTSGMRQAKNAFQETQEEFGRLFPKEKEQLQNNQNTRNVFFSGFGEKDRTDLTGSQDLRSLQVQRALNEQTEGLTKSREFGLEEGERGMKKTIFDLERQKGKEADTMAQQKIGIGWDKYNIQLEKQKQEESRRVAGISNQATTGSLTGGTSSSKSTGQDSDSAFRNFMQTTGKQGELDKATFGSTQMGSNYQALKKKYGY